MAIENASFEDAGAWPGEAAHWTLVAVCTAEEIAAFGADPLIAWEGFERWSLLMRLFGEGSLIVALFDAVPEAREDFEEGWDSAVYLTEWHDGFSEAASFGDGTIEDGEAGWANESYARTWDDVAAEAALFDGDPVEAFVPGYLWSFGPDGTERAYFPDTAETFSTVDGWDLAETI